MNRNFFLIAMILFGGMSVFAQNTGIGTYTPQARLHVADSSVLFSGPSSLPSIAGGPPASGAGTRMMWYSNKAAFRVGQVFSTNWNETNIGLHSLAAGYNTRASGQYASAFGNGSFATGTGSLASGNNTTASGQYATAIGQNTTASSFGSLVAGRYNILSGSGNTWNETDPLFTIGNGYETVENNILTITRRNALLIKKNADAEISGNATVKKSLTINDSLIAQGGAGITGNSSVSGLFGIGTTTPHVSLDVNGALVLRPKNVLISANSQVIDVGNSSFIILKTAGDQGFGNITLGPCNNPGQIVYLVFLGPFGHVNMYSFATFADRMEDHDTMTYIYDGLRWARISMALDN